MTDSILQPSSAAGQRRADLLKATCFRQVADGYIYRSPNPWIFGRADHYLVTGPQRDAIIGLLMSTSSGKTPASRLTRAMIVSFVGVSIALLASSMLLMYSGQYPALIPAGIAATVLMVALLAATIWMLHKVAALQLANVKPILADAAKTNERISNADVLWASRTGGDVKSVRRRWAISGAINALVSAAFLSFAYLSWHPGEGSFNGATSFFIMVAGLVFGFQAAFHCYCALSGRLPSYARQAEQVCSRTVIYGAAGFAVLALGYAGLLGAGVIPPDFAATRVRNERLATDGDPEAMSRLAAEFRDGRGGARDYVKAREWYGKAAATGDATAMFWAGWLQQQGYGGAQDLASGRAWFEKAAAKGDGAAISWLGVNAQFGIGVTKDVAEAKTWFEKAAAAGNSSGMNSLGTLYRDGLGVPRDDGTAREWFEKAAAAGSAASLNELGLIYLNGSGVPRDLGKALAWYEKAAAVEQLDGMQHLAIFLDGGKAGPADPKRAAHLLLSSAHLGHPWSKTVLGGPLLFLTPATRTGIKRELSELGYYHGPVDDDWNDGARAAVAAYLKLNG